MPMKRTSPVRLTCPAGCTLAAGEGEEGGFSMLGYTGARITQFWDDFVIELSGMGADASFPILREHQRDRIVGKATSWSVDDAGFHILGEFSETTPDAKEIRGLCEEGHPWQCSVGVWPVRVERIEAGASVIVNGREEKGPLNIWKESKVRECSFVSLGADPNTSAKKLSEGDDMNKKLREALLRLGLSGNATEEEALAFLNTLSATQREGLKTDGTTGGQPEQETGKGLAGLPAPAQPAGLSATDAQAAALAAVREERERVSGITALCGRHGLAELAEGFIAEGVSLADARGRVLDKLAEGNRPVGVLDFIGCVDESDKFRPLAAEGFFLRMGGRVEKPQEGSQQFRAMSLLDFARLSLERGGQSTRGLSHSQIARELLSGGGVSLASRSDFKAVFADVAQRRLQEAYTEAPASWRPWVKVVPATSFKPITGVSLSNAPDFEMVREGGEYRMGSLKDSQESYRVGKYGVALQLTMEMMVDDDLRAFARIPSMFGASAARLYSDLAYSPFKDNPKMNDGKTLFHADRGNIAKTGAKVAVDSLDAMRLSIRHRRGMQGEMLDLRPKYILVPDTMQTETEILLRSAANPQSGLSSGVYNPAANWGLTPIGEARLSDVSDKEWYLLADPSQCDFVEMAFLDGQEAPVVEEERDMMTDSFMYRARTVVGVGVLDWRGIQKNPGAA